MIPYYRFLHKEKLGINVEDYDFHSEIIITFDSCDANVKRIDWQSHYIDMNDSFEIRSIAVGKNKKKQIISWLTLIP